MKRQKVDPPGPRRFRLSYFLFIVAALYLAFLGYKFPELLEIASGLSGDENYSIDRGSSDDSNASKASVVSSYRDTLERKLEDNRGQEVSTMASNNSMEDVTLESQPIKPSHYGRITSDSRWQRNKTGVPSVLERMADEAWTLGLKAWEDLENYDIGDISESSVIEGTPESCPSSISMTGKDLASRGHVMFLPCGLAAGSSISVVGRPHYAHREYVPQLAKFKNGNPWAMVSQFNVELQGLKSVEGEAPPKIMHLNPRLRGDWSHKTVIEHNTCYRMQWGKAQRCDGARSGENEDMLSKDCSSS